VLLIEAQHQFELMTGRALQAGSMAAMLEPKAPPASLAPTASPRLAPASAPLPLAAPALPELGTP
jgi:hypothetical protein